MGYTTDFRGEFFLDKPLTEAHAAYITQFGDTRRMSRHEHVAVTLPDPLREAVGLPVGENGCYFVGGLRYAGQDDDASVEDHNSPPRGQPGLWCQWQPSDDRSKIVWDGSEKFYDYVEWLQYLIDHFLQPWGYKLDGRVEYQGEDTSDYGTIAVISNRVIRIPGSI